MYSLLIICIGILVCTVFASLGGFWFAIFMLMKENGGENRFTRRKTKFKKDPKRITDWISMEDYRTYLKSEAWRAKRRLVLAYVSDTCITCNTTLTETSANIHHISYERVRNESLNDLIPLCKTCHKEIHGRN